MHLLSCKCLCIFVTPPHLVCTVPQYFIFIHSTHRNISTYLEIRIGRFFFFYTRQNMITQQDSEKTFCRIINTFRNLSVHPEFLITLQTPGLRHTYTILGGTFSNSATITPSSTYSDLENKVQTSLQTFIYMLPLFCF